MVEPARLGHEGRQGARHGVRPRRGSPASSPSSCIGCGAMRPSSSSAGNPAPPSSRPERGEARHHASERVTRIVPAGDDGRGDLVKSPEPADHRKVVDRLRRFALLTPSCGGPSADREEKRVTRGSDKIRTRTDQEQLDLPDPNQRGLLDPAKGTVLFAPRYHAADQKKTAPRSGLS